MVREILFKAKRLDNGEWVEGLLWKKKYQSNKWFISCFPDKDDNEEVYVIDINTLCQYTGLLDKNGNKIWENDVVEHSDEIYRVHFVVKYGEYHNDGNKDCYVGFYADWFQTLDSKYLRKDIGFWVYNREIEVIGNIFDNPELLGGAE